MDDLLIFWEKKEDEKRIKAALQKQFAMRDLGQAQEVLRIKLNEQEDKGNCNTSEVLYHSNVKEISNGRFQACQNPYGFEQEMDDRNGSIRTYR